jgi:hypothetical protein
VDIAVIWVDAEDVDPVGNCIGDVAMKQFVRAHGDDEQKNALRQLEYRDKK